MITIRFRLGIFMLLAWSVLLICSTSSAQAGRKISVFMIDGRSGQAITTSELQVWFGASFDSAKTAGVSPRYIKLGPDGVGEVVLPADANVFTVHAQYGSASWDM